MAFQRNGAAAPTTRTATYSDSPAYAPAGTQALTTAVGTAVTYKANGEEVSLSFDDVKTYLCPAANDQECKLFIELCRANGLNPFLREAYLIKYDQKAAASMVVGKDAFTKRAEEHPQFDGFEAGLVLLADGKIEYREGSAAYAGEEILGGWAKVYRKDRTRPYFEEVSLNEYDKKQSKWKDSPGTMIRKVALVHALREAFPTRFGGLYTPEEMGVDVENASFREVPYEEPAPVATSRRRTAKGAPPELPAASDDPLAGDIDPLGGDLP